MTYYRRPYPVWPSTFCSAVKFARAATAYIPATDKFAPPSLRLRGSFRTAPAQGNEFSLSGTDEPASFTQHRKDRRRTVLCLSLSA
jgi:hypothetical protein